MEVYSHPSSTHPTTHPSFTTPYQNALKYGFRPLKLLSGLTIGNPNIPLALCYPVMIILTLLSLVTELLAHRFLVLEAKVWTEKHLLYWRVALLIARYLFSMGAIIDV